MTIETATDVTQLNASYPAVGDPLGQGDEHIRLLKSTILYTFAGATSTGVTGFNVATQLPGNNTTLAASTAFVSAGIAAAAFSTALPSQAGNAGKYVFTDGATASWEALPSYITNASYRSFNTAYGAFNGNNP